MNKEQLTKVLLNRIEANEFLKDEALPTEDQLIKEYGASRYAVRSAIDNLVEMCVVYKVQGSGVYLRDTLKEGYFRLSNTKGFHSEFPNRKVGTEVISFDTILPDAELQEAFKCEASDEVYKVVRLRLVDDIPYALETSHYLKKYIKYLNTEIVMGSVFNYIQNVLELTIGFADKVVGARLLTPMESKHLKLGENFPALVTNDTVYLSGGQIFDVSTIVYNSELVKFYDLALFK